jgi:tripartite-type tricarboxylate transporter receptor subunit TctC
MTSAVMIGRPLATTPGVPVERVTALRQAFEATVKDPEFIADADRQHAEIRPMSGEAMARLIDDLIGAPKEVRDRVKTALEPKSADAKKVSDGKRVSSE